MPGRKSSAWSDRLREEPSRSRPQDIRQGIVDLIGLTKPDDVTIRVHGVSLSPRGSGRLDTSSPRPRHSSAEGCVGFSVIGSTGRSHRRYPSARGPPVKVCTPKAMCGPPRFDLGVRFGETSLSVLRVLRAEAELFLAHSDERPQILRNGSPELIHAGLRVLRRTGYRKSHLYPRLYHREARNACHL